MILQYAAKYLQLVQNAAARIGGHTARKCFDNLKCLDADFYLCVYVCVPVVYVLYFAGCTVKFTLLLSSKLYSGISTARWNTPLCVRYVKIRLMFPLDTWPTQMVGSFSFVFLYEKQDLLDKLIVWIFVLFWYMFTILLNSIVLFSVNVTVRFCPAVSATWWTS